MTAVCSITTFISGFCCGIKGAEILTSVLGALITSIFLIGSMTAAFLISITGGGGGGGGGVSFFCLINIIVCLVLSFLITIDDELEDF